MTPPERSGGPPAAPAAPAGPAAAPPTPPWRRPRAALLGTAAWGLALTALSLTQAEPGRTWAVLLLGLAGLGAAVAWGRTPAAPALPIAQAPPARGGRRRLGCLAAFAGAGGLGALADTQYLAHPAGVFGLAGALWLAAMGLLIAAAAAWPRAPAADPGPAPAPAWPRWEVAALGGLLLLALVLRLWSLQDVPFAIHGDEILAGQVARESFLDTSAPAAIFSTVWQGIDLPALWFLGLAAALRVGGEWLAMLRLQSALFGAFTVLPFYGLIRGTWGRTAALAGTALLAVSAVDIHYSRVAIPNIATPFFWAVCFYFLLRGLRTRRPLDWVWAGLAAGLSEYTYYGTHLLPFLLLAFAGYLLVVHGRHGRRYLGQFALLALGYLVAFGPLLAYFLHFRPDIYFGRAAAQGALMWDHIPRDWADLQAMWNTLWPLMAGNLLGFSTDPSQDSVYGAPLLFPVEAAVLVLGVALLLRQWRHPAAFLLLLSGAGVLVVGGTFVHGVPFIAHWTPAFPAFYAAIAVALGAWAGSWSGLRPPWPTLGRAVLAVALLGDAALNLDFYFNQYYLAPVGSLEVRAAQSRWEAALGPDYRIYTVGNGSELYEPLTNSFLVHGQQGAALTRPATQLPLPPAPGKGLAFVFFVHDDLYRPLVEALYPGGREGEIHGRDGTHLFVTYRLTPAQLTALATRSPAAVQAVLAAFQPVRLAAAGRIPPAGSAGWQAARGLAVLPDGALVVGDTGNHRVLVYGPDGHLRAAWDGAGPGAAPFQQIGDVAAAPDGTIAVLDAESGDIGLFREDGHVVGRLPQAQTGLHIASGLAWTPDGAGLYVADTSGGQVLHLARDGSRLGVLHDGGAGRPALGQPLDVAVTPDGRVFVADLQPPRVVQFSAAGQMEDQWIAPVVGQQGGNHLAVWQGVVAMTNPADGTLYFVTPGAPLRVLDPADAARLHLAQPIGIAAGPDGRLDVLSSGDSSITILAAPAP